ncbi:MAG: hypothetical protein HRU09_07785 [Oligoflexales bacterium]|nr:hypothetical protein [Oligoflexales bacterium]
MKDLFLVPFSKLVYYRTFWVFLVLILGVTFAFAGIISSLPELPVSGVKLPISGFFSYPQVWVNVSWFMKFGTYFLGFLVILLVTNDDESKLLKQHIIDGWDRERALASYLLVCGTFAFMSLFVSIFIALVFGVKGDEPYFNANSLQCFLYFFMQSFIVFEFALVLSLLLRKAVWSILVFIVWQIILEPIIGWILDLNGWELVSKYLPFHVVGTLIPDPYVPKITDLLKGATDVPIDMVAVAGVYICFFAGAAWLKLKFTDY